MWGSIGSQDLRLIVRHINGTVFIDTVVARPLMHLSKRWSLTRAYLVAMLLGLAHVSDRLSLAEGNCASHLATIALGSEYHRVCLSFSSKMNGQVLMQRFADTRELKSKLEQGFPSPTLGSAQVSATDSDRAVKLL